MMRSAANGTIERITQPQAHLCSGLTHPYQRGLNYKHLLAKRDDSISFPNHILSSVIFISNVASVSYLFMTLNKDNKEQNWLPISFISTNSNKYLCNIILLFQEDFDLTKL